MITKCIFETTVSLFVTTMDKFDQEAISLSARDSSYELDSAKLSPDSLFIGEKILIFAYPDNYNVFENFW